MASLTSEHLKDFAKVTARLGLSSENHSKQQKELDEAKAKKANLVFSSDPLESDVTPVLLSVGSIAELNKYVGVPDANDDEHIAYPEPLPAGYSALHDKATSKADLESKLDDNFRALLKKAAECFIMGNSKKVASWEKMINSLMFPGVIAVFEGQDLNIPPGTTYTISGSSPVFLNYQTITVGQGAQILVQTDANVTAQIFTQA